MDKSERETHDFMNVESFSQLPFIRPAPPPLKEKGILRLFGKEFGGAHDAASDGAGEISMETNTCEDTKQEMMSNENNGGGDYCGISRRFECHYCCRNFPTSQALGGHQNAHKRERQHAKRAHLHSAASSFSAHDTHLYGGGALMNYRYYQQPPPIIGNPLALCQIPTTAATHTTTIPSNNLGITTFNPDRLMHRSPSSYGVHGGDYTSQYMYESKPSVQDHVSLDLHL